MIRLLTAFAIAWGSLVSNLPAQEAKPPGPGRLVSIAVAWAEFDPALFSANVQEPGAGAKLLEALRAAAEGQDKVYSFTEVRLAALENAPASVHFGERVNVAVSRTGVSSRESGFGGAPGFSTAYQQQSVGTIVGATCRVDDAGQILIDLNIEQSKMATDADGRPDTSDGGGAQIPKPVTKTFKTTVSVPDGQTLVLGGLLTRSGKQRRQDVMLVTARVIGATTARAPEAPPAREPRAGTIDERYQRFAESRIKPYDRNGDGSLDAEELEGAPEGLIPRNADRDRDGKISAEELTAALSRR
jgi:hypothetical protein